MNDRLLEYFQSCDDEGMTTWTTDFSEWWHRWCDKLNLSYDISFENFTLALGDYIWPNRILHHPNRAERRKMKKKKD